jgi:hypothetical protein
VITALEPAEPTRAARRRLRLAAAARAAIDHPNLLRARPIGEGQGRLFVAVERCPYPSLTDLLADGPLEATSCVRILVGAAAGMAALSERALVARGLTPNHVFVDPEHGCKLMDLGIPPELLRQVPGEHHPEPGFRSPEELEQKPVDLRSGVYSLGALLVTGLTGLPPDKYSAGVPEAGLRRSDRRSELSPEIEAVIARALARDPAERYASPGALSRAVAAALGAELPRNAVRSDHKPNGRPQRSPNSLIASPMRNGHGPTRAPSKNGHRAPPSDQAGPQPRPGEVPPSSPRPEPRAASRPAHGVAADLLAAARRRVAGIATLLAVAAGAVRRGKSALLASAGRAAPIVGRTANVAAGATRRSAQVVWTLFLGVVLPAAGRAAALGAVAARRAQRALVQTLRSERGWGSGLRPAATETAARRVLKHRRVWVPGVGAVVASALAGIVLAGAFEPKARPSSVSASGLTVQIPPGWEPAGPDPGLPALSSPIAAGPSGEAGAGLLAGRLRSVPAAERMLARLQTASDARTPVRLGGLDAWQYAGLRPRAHAVGTGYLVPTTSGAVLVMCHRSANAAPARLAECKRAATTLAVGGEQPRPLSAADRSNERMTRVISMLRTSRSEGRRRLAVAKLDHVQAREATSLQLSHERAARALDRISALENGHSLGNLSEGLREAAAAYGRLASAASAGSPWAYSEARDAVVRQDAVVHRELARMGDS